MAKGKGALAKSPSGAKKTDRSYQDIQKQADKIGYLLKPSEAKKILSKLEEFYTPEIGMSQEIIDIYIQDHIEFNLIGLKFNIIYFFIN